MATWNTLAVIVAAFITLLSTAEGFFLYSTKKNQERKPINLRPERITNLVNPEVSNGPIECGQPHYQILVDESSERVMPPPSSFYRDAMIPPPHNPWGAQYAFDGAGPVTVALPVAVPIQAQMAPVPPSLKGTVHNVQLVPCLCPVSKDIDPTYLSPLPQQQPQQSSSTNYVVQPQPAPSQTS